MPRLELESKELAWGAPQGHGWSPKAIGGPPRPWVVPQGQECSPKAMGAPPMPWVLPQGHGCSPKAMGGPPRPWVLPQGYGFSPKAWVFPCLTLSTAFFSFQSTDKGDTDEREIAGRRRKGRTGRAREEGKFSCFLVSWSLFLPQERFWPRHLAALNLSLLLCKVG